MKIKEVITIKQLKKAIENKGIIFFNEINDKEELIKLYKDNLKY